MLQYKSEYKLGQFIENNDLEGLLAFQKKYQVDIISKDYLVIKDIFSKDITSTPYAYSILHNSSNFIDYYESLDIIPSGLNSKDIMRYIGNIEVIDPIIASLIRYINNPSKKQENYSRNIIDKYSDTLLFDNYVYKDKLVDFIIKHRGNLFDISYLIEKLDLSFNSEIRNKYIEFNDSKGFIKHLKANLKDNIYILNDTIATEVLAKGSIDFIKEVQKHIYNNREIQELYKSLDESKGDLNLFNIHYCTRLLNLGEFEFAVEVLDYIKDEEAMTDKIFNTRLSSEVIDSKSIYIFNKFKQHIDTNSDIILKSQDFDKYNRQSDDYIDYICNNGIKTPSNNQINILIDSNFNIKYIKTLLKNKEFKNAFISSIDDLFNSFNNKSGFENVRRGFTEYIIKNIENNREDLDPLLEVLDVLIENSDINNSIISLSNNISSNKINNFINNLKIEFDDNHNANIDKLLYKLFQLDFRINSECSYKMNQSLLQSALKDKNLLIIGLLLEKKQIDNVDIKDNLSVIKELFSNEKLDEIIDKQYEFKTLSKYKEQKFLYPISENENKLLSDRDLTLFKKLLYNKIAIIIKTIEDKQNNIDLIINTL
jgi:hypothetical protein